MSTKVPSSRRKGGFTVIEVLIAMSVLLLCVGSMIGLSKWVMRSTEYSARMTKGTALAQDKLENILRSGFTAAASGTDGTQGFARVWSVSTVGGVKQITVTCSWTGMNAKVSSVQLRGMIAP